MFGVRERCEKDDVDQIGGAGAGGKGWKVGLYLMAFNGLEPYKDENLRVAGRWESNTSGGGGGSWVPCQTELGEI